MKVSDCQNTTVLLKVTCRYLNATTCSAQDTCPELTAQVACPELTVQDTCSEQTAKDDCPEPSVRIAVPVLQWLLLCFCGKEDGEVSGGDEPTVARYPYQGILHHTQPVTSTGRYLKTARHQESSNYRTASYFLWHDTSSWLLTQFGEVSLN